MANDDCSVPLNADSLHDLAGPIDQMRSMVDLMLKMHGGKLDKEAKTLLAFMQNSSDRLQNLLSGLHSYMLIADTNEPYRHFDGNAVISGALAAIQPIIDRNDALVTHDPLPVVFGDPNQICHIFTTLIDNSIKFRSPCRPEIHVTAVPRENGWLFSICDNGIGIDPRYCDRIFGVFKRIHNEKYPGAGMGLAIAKRIIERHGGKVWAVSHLGHGATFFFTLPYA